MTAIDLSLLLAALGGTSVAASWMGRHRGRSGARSIALLASAGASLLAGAAALLLSIAGTGSSSSPPLMP